MSRRPESLPNTLLLRQCEAVVDVELGHLWKLHRALELIASQQLYRPEFDTFEAYLATRWPKGTAGAFNFIPRRNYDLPDIP